MDTSGIVTIAIAVLALAAATPLVYRQRKKATVDLEETTLALAQREIQIERDARLAQEQRCNERIDELTRKHNAELAAHKESNAAEIGELRGQVNVMTDRFVASIVEAVLAGITRAST